MSDPISYTNSTRQSVTYNEQQQNFRPSMRTNMAIDNLTLGHTGVTSGSSPRNTFNSSVSPTAQRTSITSSAFSNGGLFNSTHQGNSQRLSTNMNPHSINLNTENQLMDGILNDRSSLAYSTQSHRWADPTPHQSDSHTLVNSQSNYHTLAAMKNILSDLLREFKDKKLSFEGNQGEDFGRRLLVLERDLVGFMKRYDEHPGRQFNLDQERQVNDLQRKLQDITENYRRLSHRELEKDDEIKRLDGLVNEKNKQIKEMKRLLDLHSTLTDKLGDKVSSMSSVHGLDEMIRAIKNYSETEYERERGQDGKSYLSQLDKDIDGLKRKQACSLPELERSLETFILNLPSTSYLRDKLTRGQLRLKEYGSYTSMRDKMALASDIYSKQIDQLKKDNPSMKITPDTRILDVLRSDNSRATIINSIVTVQHDVVKTREVPASGDSRLRELLQAFRSHLLDMHKKYPKLKTQIDSRLTTFLERGFMDGGGIDNLNNITNIVQYVPQIVTTENVYREANTSNKRLQFHLRVLLKALLEEMERIKRTKGIAFELDEGLYGMINTELGDLGEVRDILYSYRGPQRVREVEKVMEKTVDNIVRVPQKFALNQYESKTVDMQKPYIVMDEKAVFLEAHRGIPLYEEKAVELMNTTEKVVAHPQMHERVVIETREKTKLSAVDAFKDKIVEVEKPVYVTEEKIVVQKEIQEVEVIKEVVRYVENTNEVVKPVQVLVEKIVEKIVQREKIVPVPHIVEKIVEVIRYEKAPEMIPFIETRVEIIKEIVEKIVPVIQYEERIVTVPQIIEKIVTVERRVQLPPREIEVIREVLRIQKEIEYVEIEVPKIIFQKEIQIKEVEKYIEHPVIVPQIRVEKEIHQIPIVEVIERETHIPVEVLRHIVVVEERPVEVIRNVPYVMREEVPVPFREEKIIPVDLYFERIKEVPTIREKIVEKMVEVPKCVEIEKIVEKIVIVPRIIEKIVEVPQFIEKIVEKIVQVPVQMPPVEHFIEKQVRVEVPVEVYRDKIVYVTVEKAVQMPANTILVKDKEVRTETRVETMIQERVVVNREEVPVEMLVEKIVAYPVPTAEIHYVDRVMVRPVEVPVPVNLEHTVPVYINTESIQVQPVPHIVQKIVEKVVTKVQPQIIDRRVDKVVVEQKYEFKEVPKVYIEKQIEPVNVINEKIVEVRTIIENLREVPFMVEKLVPVMQEKFKVYEFEKEPRVVYTPPTIQIIDRIVPRIINVNKYVEKIVQKLVEVPHLLREIEIVKERHERNVPGPENTKTTMKTVDIQHEVELIREKERIVTEKVNTVEKILQTVVDVMERERDPVIITQDRIIEIPHVIEKIVERVIMMPQVVEVMKYVTEIFENESGLGDLTASFDIGAEASEYKRLGEDLEKEIATFLQDLGKIKALQPASVSRITALEDYLTKFRRFIKYPKIHEIIKEKIVEKDRIVRVPNSKLPTQFKFELAKNMLLEKLITELNRLKKSGTRLELDDDIRFVLALDFEGTTIKDVNNRLSLQLKDFQTNIQRKFEGMGGWTPRHQQLLNTFLEDRFTLSNFGRTAKDEARKLKHANEQLTRDCQDSRNSMEQLYKSLQDYRSMMPDILKVLQKQDQSLAQAYGAIMSQCNDVCRHIERTNVLRSHTEIHTTHILETTDAVSSYAMQQAIASAVREKESEIQVLREQLKTGKVRTSDHAHCNATIKSLDEEIKRLNARIDQLGGDMKASQSEKNTIRNLQNTLDKLNRQIAESNNNNNNLQSRNRHLEEEISKVGKSAKSTTAGHDACNTQIKGLENDLQRAKMELEKLRSRGESHESCLVAQKNLQKDIERKEAEVRDLKNEIREYMGKLNKAQNEIKSLTYRIETNSPKAESQTNNSVASRKIIDSSSTISKEKRDSVSGYGNNYKDYINADASDLGMVENSKASYDPNTTGGSFGGRGRNNNLSLEDRFNQTPNPTQSQYVPNTYTPTGGLRAPAAFGKSINLSSSVHSSASQQAASSPRNNQYGATSNATATNSLSNTASFQHEDSKYATQNNNLAGNSNLGFSGHLGLGSSSFGNNNVAMSGQLGQNLNSGYGSNNTGFGQSGLNTGFGNNNQLGLSGYGSNKQSNLSYGVTGRTSQIGDKSVGSELMAAQSGFSGFKGDLTTNFQSNQHSTGVTGLNTEFKSTTMVQQEISESKQEISYSGTSQTIVESKSTKQLVSSAFGNTLAPLKAPQFERKEY